jgi:hypothetical protein
MSSRVWWVIEDVLSNTKDFYLSKFDAYRAFNWYGRNYPDLKLQLRRATDEEVKNRRNDLQIYVCCLVKKKQVV